MINHEAFGFVHSMNAAFDHDQALDRRCLHCNTCTECTGNGVVEKGKKTNTLIRSIDEEIDYPATYPSSLNESTTKLSALHFPTNPKHIHPHILLALKNVNMNPPEVTLNNSVEDVDKENKPAIPSHYCLRCDGKGFNHSSDKKHDSKHASIKCKNCTGCKMCDGTGLSGTKIACLKCKSKIISCQF